MKKINRESWEKVLSSPLKESFRSGTSDRIMKLLESYISKRTTFEVDYDYADAFDTPNGKIKGYYADAGKGDMVRINFELGGSERVHSVDFIYDNDRVDNPSATLVFDTGLNAVQTARELLEFVMGHVEESTVSRKGLPPLLTERKGFAKQIVVGWLENEDFADRRLDMIQNERLTSVYQDFVRTKEAETPVSSASFFNYVKEYLSERGLENQFARPRYKVEHRVKQKPIPLPLDTEGIKKVAENQKEFIDWRVAFEDLEFQFEDLMDDRQGMPFGMVVYGPGGSGKSFYFMNEAEKYDSEIKKGAINSRRLVEILYENRDKDLIIFDDADSVVTNRDSANILKAATTDTGARRINLKSKTGMFKNFEGDSFELNAVVIVITNLSGIKDEALQSRMYLAPIFMTKEEIIEKITETIDPSVVGATEREAKMVATFLTGLLETGSVDIADEFLQYRFFKMGMKAAKKHSDWQGWLLRKMGIGIRTEITRVKRGRR